MINNNSVQRCLVTGANGFLGSALVHHLQKSSTSIRALSRQPSIGLAATESVVGELGSDTFDLDLLCAEIDTVFHLANTAHTAAPSARYQSDCDSTIKLAQAACKAGVKRFVFVSSVKAVEDPGLYRRDEAWNGWPKDSYGYWKRMAEKILLNEIDIPHIAIIRPCLMYGIGVKGNLQKMLKAVSGGYFPPLPETYAERSMVSLVDTVASLMVVAQNPLANRQPFIVADGEAYTAHSIYRAIRLALGKGESSWAVPLSLLKNIALIGDMVQRGYKDFPVSSAAISRLIEPAAYSSEKLHQLGWLPTTTFYRELPEIIAEYFGEKA